MRVTFLFIFFCLGSNSLWAADITHVLHQAIERDHRVLAAQAFYQAKRVEAEGAAWSAYSPTLRGRGSIGYSKNENPFTVDGPSRVYGLELEQAIPLFGRESAQVQLARSQAQVEAAELERVKQVVLAEMLEALLRVKAFKERLVLRQKLLANMLEQLAAVKQAVSGGGLVATEIRLVESRLTQATALRNQASADANISQSKLAHLLPDVDHNDLPKDVLQVWWSDPVILERLQQSAMDSAPSLLKAQTEADRAEAQYDSARSQLWPQVSIRLQGQRGRVGGRTANSQSISLELNAPLYEGGASTTRIESAAYQLQAAKENVAYERQRISFYVSDALALWQAAKETAAVWTESERQEDLAIALVEEQLAADAATYIDLLEARRIQLENLLQGVNYRLERDQAWIDLMKQVGALKLPT